MKYWLIAVLFCLINPATAKAQDLALLSPTEMPGSRLVMPVTVHNDVDNVSDLSLMQYNSGAPELISDYTPQPGARARNIARLFLSMTGVGLIFDLEFEPIP